MNREEYWRLHRDTRCHVGIWGAIVRTCAETESIRIHCRYWFQCPFALQATRWEMEAKGEVRRRAKFAKFGPPKLVVKNDDRQPAEGSRRKPKLRLVKTRKTA